MTDLRVIPFPAPAASTLPSWCERVRLRGRIPAITGTIRGRCFHDGEWHYDVLADGTVIRDVRESEIERC